MKKINLILLVGSLLLIGKINAQNYFAGTNAGHLATGAGLTGVGYFSQSTGTTGSANTSVGNVSMSSLTSGGNNAAFGDHAMISLTSGSYNTGIGSGAGLNLTTGGYNTAIGMEAMVGGTSSYCTAVGCLALWNIQQLIIMMPLGIKR